MKIEKNVPIPKPFQNSGRKSKFPFSKMEEGDSFLVDGYCPQKMSSISTYGRDYFKRNDSDYTCCARKEGDAIRIWKIKR